MTELEEALDTLKARLGQGGHAAEIVTDTADEYALHPSLLSRKFEERFSVSPAAYVPSTSLATLNRRKARKEAFNMAWQSHSQLQTILTSVGAIKNHQKGKDKWIEQQVREHHLGAIFVESGYEYAFAGLSLSRTIMAVPVDDSASAKKSAHLHRVDFQDEIEPRTSGIIWRMGNPRLKFATEDTAHDWLHERTVVRAIDDLT